MGVASNKTMMRRRRRIITGLVVLAILIVAGVLVFDNLFGFGGPVSGDASAPTLIVETRGQVVYRIDTTQSLARYSVQETFVGQPISTAVGTTQQMAGDILIDHDDYSQSQVGTIVINVEQFTSDSSLRDRRIRREFLESEAYPEAVFVPTELLDFPTQVVEGSAYTFEILGDLTIRETTLPTRWTVTVTLAGDTLMGAANTVILMSDFGVGPIDIAGLVATEDEVRLEFEFIAVAVDEAVPEVAR
jgi:polyisoprenoid-binding protein YceI